MSENEHSWVKMNAYNGPMRVRWAQMNTCKPVEICDQEQVQQLRVRVRVNISK